MARLMASGFFGYMKTFCSDPSYQVCTNTRNTPTAFAMAGEYSLSQSIFSPPSWRAQSFAARLADSSASVTPELKMGSRNSEALPVTAQPGPWYFETDAVHPSRRVVFITGVALASRFWMFGSAFSSE